jgi:hypothetical protein
MFSWLASLEATNWLSHISSLIKTALAVAKAVEQERQHVVVHCSDGWDRTPQVVALAELLLDPFYRTIKVRVSEMTPYCDEMNEIVYIYTICFSAGFSCAARTRVVGIWSQICRSLWSWL